MISLKDYAKQHNVTYEAVRQQVNRYKEELEGHITKDGRQQFLDDEAVAFLDEKRQKNPVVVIQMDKDEQIAYLERENKSLLKENNQLLKDRVKTAELIASANFNQALLEERTNELAEAKDEVEEQRKRAEDAEKEVLELKEQIQAMKEAGLLERLRGWK